MDLSAVEILTAQKAFSTEFKLLSEENLLVLQLRLIMV